MSVHGLPRYRDTVDVVDGWNMIGGISEAVSSVSVVEDPPGILETGFHEFGTTGYAVAGMLLPGHGYWVKASAPGRLIIMLGDRDDDSPPIMDRPVRLPGPWH